MDKIVLNDLHVKKVMSNSDYLLGVGVTYPLGVKTRTRFAITPDMLLKDMTEYVNNTFLAGTRYDSSSKEIIFYNSNGVTLFTIDATDFIKDGMISSVEYDSDNAVLSLVFNTDAEAEQIDIDLSSLIDIYTGGAGINITDNVVSINLADDNEDDYLSVSDNGLKLSGVVNINSRLEEVEEFANEGAITNEEIDVLFS